MRANRQKLRGNLHLLLAFHHFADQCFVIKGLLTAWYAALKQSVVALCIEQPLFVKSRFLKAMVYVGRDDEVVFIRHQLQQILINRPWRAQIAADVNVPAPIGPMLLRGRKGIKTAGVHIPEIVFFREIGKVLLEPFAGVDKPGGGGKSGPRADHDRVRRFQLIFQTGDRIRAVFGRDVRPIREIH